MSSICGRFGELARLCDVSFARKFLVIAQAVHLTIDGGCMGVHFCGWCGEMSGGGFCDPCEKEYEEAEKRLKSIISVEAYALHQRIKFAAFNCD